MRVTDLEWESAAVKEQWAQLREDLLRTRGGLRARQKRQAELTDDCTIDPGQQSDKSKDQL